MFKAGEVLSKVQAQLIAKAGGLVWVVHESFDPSDYQYEGPGEFEEIGDGVYYLNEYNEGGRNAVAGVSFSITDIDFEEFEDMMVNEWDEGRLEIRKVIQTFEDDE